jgi:protein-disulfide isomerase
LKNHARTLKLDGDRFDKCLDRGAQFSAVRADLEEAKSLGLSGTPSFFLNDHFFSGVVDYTALKGLVDQQLALQARPHSEPDDTKQVSRSKASDADVVTAKK